MKIPTPPSLLWRQKVALTAGCHSWGHHPHNSLSMEKCWGLNETFTSRLWPRLDLNSWSLFFCLSNTEIKGIIPMPSARHFCSLRTFSDHIVANIRTFSKQIIVLERKLKVNSEHSRNECDTAGTSVAQLVDFLQFCLWGRRRSRQGECAAQYVLREHQQQKVSLLSLSF